MITLNGFSKAAAMTGWRLGYACAPKEVIGKMSILSQHTISCLSQFSMEAALAALDCQEIARMVASYDARRSFFVKGLNDIPESHALSSGAHSRLGESRSCRKRQF